MGRTVEQCAVLCVWTQSTRHGLGTHKWGLKSPWETVGNNYIQTVGQQILKDERTLICHWPISLIFIFKIHTCIFSCLFWDKASCSPSWSQMSFEVEPNLELPSPASSSDCWSYRLGPPCLLSVCMIVTCQTSTLPLELYPQPHTYSLLVLHD